MSIPTGEEPTEESQDEWAQLSKYSDDRFTVSFSGNVDIDGASLPKPILRLLDGKPTYVDTYELLLFIGKGGMGSVVQARDKFGRLVAIKFMAAHIASNRAAFARFVREARASARIVHPNVIRVYDIEIASELPFIVMEYVQGQSLQSRMCKAPLAQREIVAIASSVALALAAAHSQGVVHRDVKPANVLLDEVGKRVLLADFGLAKSLDDATITGTGDILGTPSYMSPEQICGHRLDHRTDLFALGCMIYAMCTGRPPFEGGALIGTMQRVLKERPNPILLLRPDISSNLAFITEKLIEKDKWNRFQSASEVSCKLKLLLEELSNLEPDAPIKLVSAEQNGSSWRFSFTVFFQRNRRAKRVQKNYETDLGNSERRRIDCSTKSIHPRSSAHGFDK